MNRTSFTSARRSNRCWVFPRRNGLAIPSFGTISCIPTTATRWHTELRIPGYRRRFRSIYRFIARDGRVVWVHGEARMVRDADGRPLFLQGVAFDITNMKEAEEELKRLNQTLERRVQDRTNELAQANVTLQEEVRERKRIEAEFAARP